MYPDTGGKRIRSGYSLAQGKAYTVATTTQNRCRTDTAVHDMTIGYPVGVLRKAR